MKLNKITEIFLDALSEGLEAKIAECDPCCCGIDKEDWNVTFLGSEFDDENIIVEVYIRLKDDSHQQVCDLSDPRIPDFITKYLSKYVRHLK